MTLAEQVLISLWVFTAIGVTGSIVIISYAIYGIIVYLKYAIYGIIVYLKKDKNE